MVSDGCLPVSFACLFVCLSEATVSKNDMT